MPRFAEWREPPIDARSKDRVWKRLRSYPWHFWALISLFIVLSIIRLFDRRWGLADLYQKLLDASLHMFMMMTVTSIGLVARRRPPAELESRMDNPPIGPQCTTKIHFLYGPAQYGEDQGVLTLYEGWLHYEGLRTSFSFGADSLRDPLSKELRLSPSFDYKPDTNSEMEIDGYPIRLKLQLYGTEQEREAFETALKLWRKESSVVAGEPVLPPLYTDPNYRYTESRFIAISLLSTILGFPLFVIFPHKSFLYALGGLAMLIGGVTFLYKWPRACQWKQVSQKVQEWYPLEAGSPLTIPATEDERVHIIH